VGGAEGGGSIALIVGVSPRTPTWLRAADACPRDRAKAGVAARGVGAADGGAVHTARELGVFVFAAVHFDSDLPMSRLFLS
jgi:hypothetical protein